MKHLGIIGALLLVVYSAQAQTFRVAGSIQDTTGQALSGATVMLLNATDSVLYKFGIAGNAGQFELRAVERGSYLLQVTFIGYDPTMKDVSIDQNTDLGVVILRSSAQSLGEVTVDADAIPLEIRSDTISYNAAAFQTQPGAVVEDLLKRLPGVEVEKDGTIKAQGEEVRQIKVDGKEFFGSDPQTASKNLPADAVDKVEVYDEMSDMADFTGVDDGQRTKTINLTLKKDRKKGYFGNIEAGYGTMNRFKGRANVNRFTGKTQTSFIGMANNTNEQGFSVRDYIDFMGGFQNVASGGGRMRLNTSDLGLPISNGLSDGFITTGAGGLNLNQEFKKESQLNVSYFYSNILKDLARTIDREYVFGAGLGNAFYQQEDDQVSQFQNHNIRSTLRHKFNDKNSLIWRGSVGFNTAGFESSTFSQNLTSENVLSNSSASDYTSDRTSLNINTSATLRHKFEKKGRSLAVTGEFNNQESDQDANLVSLLTFTQPDSSQNLDQLQVDNNQNRNYAVKATYTEPLGKRRYLSLSYDHSNFSRPIDKTFTDQITGQILDSLNVAYINDYLYHRAGLSYRVIKGKSNLSFGLDGQFSQLQGQINNLPAINTGFPFLLPSLQWRYEIGQAHFVRLDYRTSTAEPSLEELQPVLNNSDPLNLYIGDPNLRPEYTHRLRINYLNFDQFTFSSLFANVTATYTTNDITTLRAVDRTQTQLSQPVNVPYNMTVRGFASYSTPIRAIASRVRFNTNLTAQRSFAVIANINNVGDYLTGIPSDRILQLPQMRYNALAGLTFENREKDIVDASVGANFSYNQTRYDDGQLPTQTFFTQTYNATLAVNLSKKWLVRTELDYAIYEGASIGTRQNVPIWQASMSRYLGKERRGEISLTAMDILNRNVGINWSSELNYIQEEVINSLGRYFMLSFKYQIRKLGK